jgi:flagellar hook-length control protein FliK
VSAVTDPASPRGLDSPVLPSFRAHFDRVLESASHRSSGWRPNRTQPGLRSPQGRHDNRRSRAFRPIDEPATQNPQSSPDGPAATPDSAGAFADGASTGDLHHTALLEDKSAFVCQSQQDRSSSPSVESHGSGCSDVPPAAGDRKPATLKGASISNATGAVPADAETGNKVTPSSAVTISSAVEVLMANLSVSGGTDGETGAQPANSHRPHPGWPDSLPVRPDSRRPELPPSPPAKVSTPLDDVHAGQHSTESRPLIAAVAYSEEESSISLPDLKAAPGSDNSPSDSQVQPAPTAPGARAFFANASEARSGPAQKLNGQGDPASRDAGTPGHDSDPETVMPTMARAGAPLPIAEGIGLHQAMPAAPEAGSPKGSNGSPDQTELPLPSASPRAQEQAFTAWQNATAQLGRIVHAASLYQDMSRAELRVQFRTDSLGTLELRAVLDGDRLGATIGVQNAQAHQALLTQLPALEQSLVHQNLRVEHLAVLNGPADGAMHSNAQEQHQPEGFKSSPSRAGRWGAEGAVEAASSKAEVAPLEANARRLSVRA